MLNVSKILTRVLVLAGAVLAMVAADVGTAHAQAANCTRLQQTLRSYDRDPGFQGAQANAQAARQLAADVQSLESAYVRNGCNDDARAGRTLTPQCQQLARQILSLRSDRDQRQALAEQGAALASQREAVLQEIARFGCGVDGSSVNIISTDRQSVFDQAFGGVDGGAGSQIIDDRGFFDDFAPGRNYLTVRTVCVRLTDGYFWPISYATLPDYMVNDLQMCRQQCPTAEVDLYFYDNPGEEPEQMRNMNGQPYSALPTAFAYRDNFDVANRCNANGGPVTGSINIAEAAGGQSRAVIAFGEASFPLPLRDPRRPAAVAAAPVQMAAANFVDIPLPRRRPAAPGEEAPAQPVASESDEMRLVRFGDRVVRVVGPETPYAQSPATGT